jgi:hypothetical protein
MDATGSAEAVSYASLMQCRRGVLTFDCGLVYPCLYAMQHCAIGMLLQPSLIQRGGIKRCT